MTEEQLCSAQQRVVDDANPCVTSPLCDCFLITLVFVCFSVRHNRDLPALQETEDHVETKDGLYVPSVNLHRKKKTLNLNRFFSYSYNNCESPSASLNADVVNLLMFILGQHRS